MFVEDNVCFGVWPKHGNFDFLKSARRPQARKGRLAAKTGRGEGGLLC